MATVEHGLTLTGVAEVRLIEEFAKWLRARRAAHVRSDNGVQRYSKHVSDQSFRIEVGEGAEKRAW